MQLALFLHLHTAGGLSDTKKNYCKASLTKTEGEEKTITSGIASNAEIIYNTTLRSLRWE